MQSYGIYTGKAGIAEDMGITSFFEHRHLVNIFFGFFGFFFPLIAAEYSYSKK